MGQFLDGGLIANNPTLDVLTDIHKYNSTVRGDQACPFGLVVSLGTGVPPPMRVTSFDVFKPDSIWDAANVLMGARALGELLVDQVCTPNDTCNLARTLGLIGQNKSNATWYSGDKQVVKLASSRNCERICLFSQKVTTI